MTVRLTQHARAGVIDAYLLTGQLLTLAGLIGGTIEYCEIIKRRARARRLEQERLASQTSGLHGLVRVSLSER